MESQQRKLRDAFGAFTTGICVITGHNGSRPFGMTVNSFSSLSLEPPLLLWNVGDHSDCYEPFRTARHFAVHVLHSDQQALSRRFATKNADKFAELDWKRGEWGSPILPEYMVCFECTTEAVHPSGDHLIMVGRVRRFDDRGTAREPLLYHRGRYRHLD
jgi:flavin reductase (DIM6/NTAB) family NADH-FMN oxidoreductase RutF